MYRSTFAFGKRVIIFAGLLAAVLPTPSYSAANVDALAKDVHLSDGRVIRAGAHQLVLTSKGTEEPEWLVVPTALRQAIARSNAIAFPESRSLVSDGHTYLLIVVSQASKQSSMGYCGAGNESTLYVLQLNGYTAVPRFSELVQSCLKSIELNSDGTRSPFASIAWNDTHDGFRIDWMTDAKGVARTVTYRLRNGRFVADGVS